MSELKTTFWPMVGGIGEGFANYLAILRMVHESKITRGALLSWLMTEFRLEETYASNVVTTLLFGPGLIVTTDGVCTLSETGRELHEKAKPDLLYTIFSRQFLGITDIVEILTLEQPKTWESLFDVWHTKINNSSKQAAAWSIKHARMQFRHRLDWLRSLSIVNKVADSYYLSKSGMEEMTRRRLSAAHGKAEEESISHSDIEDKLKMIGEFFEFMSIKRAAVNDARPQQAPKLNENRQLDCLWARVINFGGKVQYAFEVQVGGNISDAIERLEMVAPFVQKAVVVTDEQQQVVIQDRLLVKHSPLRDKIIFLSYEDINNVSEAVNALKVFTQKVFHD